MARMSSNMRVRKIVSPAHRLFDPENANDFVYVTSLFPDIKLPALTCEASSKIYEGGFEKCERRDS